MDEESALGMHIKRAAAVLVGLGGGLLLSYLLLVMTAPTRVGAEIAINSSAIGEDPLVIRWAVARVPEATTGAGIYHQRCQMCHGAKLRGDGPLAPYLSTAPRDLRGPYWIRSTPMGTAPTREDLRRVIGRGIPGTAMPGFEAALKLEDGDSDGVDLVIDELTRRVRYLRKPGIAIEPAEQAKGLDWEIALGKEVYGALGCARCHGDAGRGDGPKAEQLKDKAGRPIVPADLTRPWDFRRGQETHHLWMTFELGLEAARMPSLEKKTSKVDRLALAVYVRSLARNMMDPEGMKETRERRGLVGHGEHMAQLLACASCHTPRTAKGLPDQSLHMAGGAEVKTPTGAYHAANLTPDKGTGLGGVDPALITRTLREGLTRDGRSIDPLAMPWTWFNQLTGSDADAIVSYLGSLKPVQHQVPPPGGESTGLFGNLSMMFGGGNPAVEMVSGSAEAARADGTDDDTADSADDSAASAEAEVATDEPGEPEPEAVDEVVAAEEPAAAEQAADLQTGQADPRLVAARARYDEAKARLDDAKQAFSRAEAEYQKAKGAPAGRAAHKASGKKKKKRGKRRGR